MAMKAKRIENKKPNVSQTSFTWDQNAHQIIIDAMTSAKVNV